MKVCLLLWGKPKRKLNRKRINMGRVLMKVAWLIGVLIALYLLLWPVPIAPVSWQSPANNGFEGEFAENTRLSDLTLIDLGGDYETRGLCVKP